MASIQKVVNKKGVSYRVYVRRKGLPNISKTFLSKKQASLFALKLEDSSQNHQAYSSKLSFNELNRDILQSLMLLLWNVNWIHTSISYGYKKIKAK